MTHSNISWEFAKNIYQVSNSRMRILKNYLYNTLYQVFSIILPFVTAPYVSRVLHPNGVGIFNYTSSIVAYFSIVAILGFNVLGTNEIAKVNSSKSKRSRAFWSIFRARVLLTFVVIISYFIFVLQVKEFQFIYILQSITLLNNLTDVSWYFAGVEKFKLIAIRSIAVKMIGAGLIFLFVKQAGDLGLYVLVVGGTSLLGNIFLIFSLFREVYFVPVRDSIPMLSKYSKQSFTLFIPTVATTVYLILNKTLVGYLDSVAAAGFYAQADNLIKILLTFILSLGTVLMPHMSRLNNDGNTHQFKRIFYLSLRVMLLLSVPLMIGLIFISNRFATWFYGAQFASVGKLMVIESVTVVLIALSNTFGYQYLIPKNEVKKFTISVTAGAIVSICLSPLLILKYGATGGMFGVVMAEFVVTMIQLWFVRMMFTLSSIFGLIYRYVISGIVMAIVLRIVRYVPLNSVTYFIVAVTSGLISYFGTLIVLKDYLILNLVKYIKRGKS